MYWLRVCLLCAAMVASVSPAGAEETRSSSSTPAPICFPIEVYTRDDCSQCEQAQRFLSDLAGRRTNVRVTYHDVVKDHAALKQLYSHSKRFGIEKAGVPAILVCNQFIVGYRDDTTTGRRVEELLTIEVFTREGCPHCNAAKAFLADLERRYPGLPVRIYDVFKDEAARRRMQELAEKFRVQVPSLPLITVYGRAIVGFRDATITGREIEDLVKKVTMRCPPDDPSKAGAAPADTPESPPAPPPARREMALFGHWTEWYSEVIGPASTLTLQPSPEEPEVLPEAVPELAEEIPTEVTEASGSEPASQGVPDEIEVPFLGKLRASVLGMPLFSFLVGLLDGFNPCAMWVLVFVLSILVNLKDRWKIVAIAGTFVFVSGLAYFAFMAAWLNVFLLIGLARGVQIALGVVAVFVGAINTKDFVAFKRGLSLSIPESAKPGLYARVRQVVMAKSLMAALVGAVVLAVLVNTIELLCTAGFPAMYTEILTFRGYQWWKNYLYLAIYITAYMLDDTIMLIITVVTLSHRRLQEREGRWLKLVSGLVMLALGLTMLFKPDWLV